MAKINTVCDICGRKIEPDEELSCEIELMSQQDKSINFFELEFLDICMPCQAEIFDFIKEKQTKKGKP